MDIITRLRAVGFFVLSFTFAAHVLADALPTAVCRGVVLDAKGAPVTGATVCCYRDPSAATATAALDFTLSEQTTTDSKGGFTVSSGIGVTVLVASKEGLAPAWKTLTPAMESLSEPLVLTAPTTLAGTVVDETGWPVAYAEVWVALAKPTLASPAARIARTQLGLSPSMLIGKPAHDTFLVTTGTDGRFQLTNFPSATQAYVGTRKPGKAQVARLNPDDTLPYASGQQDIKLTLVPAANLEGKVIVASTGQPLPGARLRWMTTNDLREPVMSSADGSFKFTDVAPGKAVINAIFPGQPMPDWVAEDVRVNLAPGETRKDVIVRAMRGGIVAISLTSRDRHEPMPGMVVSAYGSPYGRFSQLSAAISAYGSGFGQFSRLSAEAVTGLDGVGWLRLLPDDWQLHVSGGQRVRLFNTNNRPATQPGVTVRSGQTNRLELMVDLGLPLSGTVCEPGGSPVGGAVVSLDSGQQARTDANGYYELRRPRPLSISSTITAASASIRVLARSAERNLAVAEMVPDYTTNLDLTLHPWVTLSARVVDTSGTPVANAVGHVSLSSRGRVSVNGQEAVQPVTSDAQGRLEFPGLLQTEGYSLSVTATGYGNASSTVHMPVPPSTRLAFPAIILPVARLKVAGIVVNTNGQPLAGETVLISGAVQPFSHAETDATGYFHFDAVCEGEVSLRVSSGMLSRAVAGDTNVVLILSPHGAASSARGATPSTRGTAPGAPRPPGATNPGSAITGIVRDASGAPLAGVHVTIYGDRFNREVTETGSDGRYSLPVRQPSEGEAQIMGRGIPTIIARDLERNLVATHTLEPATTNLDLELQPGVTLLAPVHDEYGMPMPTAIGTLLIQVGTSPLESSIDSGIPAFVTEDLIAQSTPMASIDSGIVADDRGVIEVKALPQGRHYAMTITARGYNSTKADAPAEASQRARLECPVTVLKLGRVNK